MPGMIDTIKNAFKIPDAISFEEAGGIADAMVTSYHAVREKLRDDIAR